MSSKINFFRSIPFKVSCFYSLAFSFIFIIIFVAVYFLLANYIQEAEEQWLIGEAKQLEQILKNTSIKELESHINKNAQIMGTHQVFYCIWNKKGEIISHSDSSNWKKAVPFFNTHFPWEKEEILLETKSLEKEALYFRNIYLNLNDQMVLQVVYSLKSSQQFLLHFLRYFFYAAPFIICIFFLFGYLMVRGTLSPIHTMTSIARKISRENLSQRIPTQGKKDEIDYLATTLNQMLDRISALVNNIQEMCENLAHDIRTPITRMRGTTEVALLKERDSEEYKEVLQDSLDECERLLQLLNTLLDISEVEAGIISIPKQKLEITAILANIVDMFEPLAQQKNIELLWRPNMPEAFIHGNEKHLQRAMINIIDNAIKYTEKGFVNVSVEKKDKHIILSVQDSGIGIKKSEVNRIFERFYRSDVSRSLPGSGLGLSLTKAIVKAHHGKISVKSNIKGTLFQIYLPIA